MFTGIIQDLGKVKEFSSGKLTVSTNLNLKDCIDNILWLLSGYNSLYVYSELQKWI